MIQTQQALIIVSNESKSKQKSGGVWLITDTKENTNIEGTNPEFGNIESIHSHQAEIYGVLWILLFLDKYETYFMLEVCSKVDYYCDNLEVVNT